MFLLTLLNILENQIINLCIYTNYIKLNLINCFYYSFFNLSISIYFDNYVVALTKNTLKPIVIIERLQMFNLFIGKISNVFTLAFQGLTKAVGSIVEIATTAVDKVVELVTEITTPATDILKNLPIIGEPIDSLLTTTNNLLDNVSDTLHFASDQLSTGDLLSATTNIAGNVLDTTTDLIGQTLTDISTVVEDVANLTSPISGSLLGDLPLLGDLLSGVGETADNLSGFVAETGEYVADIAPGALIADLIFNPTESIGGVLQDISGTVDSLLDDLVPVTNVIEELPVVGTIVEVVGSVPGGITDGLYDLGTLIGHVDLLDPLQLNGSLI